MAFATGNGGAFTIGSTEVAISKWTLDSSAVLANVTNSKSNKHKQRKATIKDHAFTIEFPWDDAINPEANSFQEGATISTLVFELGDSAKKFSASEGIIEKVQYVNDEDEDVVRCVCNGYLQATPTYS